MKSGVHPQWNHQVTVTCGCGNTFQTGSTKSAIQVDVCSVCHPFYTGEERFVDTQGRVDRFMNKRSAAQQQLQKSKKKGQKNQEAPKSFKELLVAEKQQPAKAN
jgi:large subunit ribosomal protein L31